MFIKETLASCNWWRCKTLTSNLLRLAKAGRTLSSGLPRVAVLFFGGSTCSSPHFLFFSKLKIVGTASFLRFSRRGLNVEPREVLIARFCWKQSAVKWSAQAWVLRRLERFSFHFYQPFFSEFRILRKLKSTYFGFRIISAVNCCTKNHANLLKTGVVYTIPCEQKQFQSNFPHFHC